MRGRHAVRVPSGARFVVAASGAGDGEGGWIGMGWFDTLILREMLGDVLRHLDTVHLVH